jgi:DNA-binding response OmpR family regulator
MSEAQTRFTNESEKPSREGKGKPVSILVIDDDKEVNQMITEYLDAYDMHAVGGYSGQELMALLAKSEPDLVILDRLLGPDDGLDLLREVRTRSDVPIIIATGYRLDETDRVMGLELGADDYVSKPFNPRELLARVRAVLRRRARAAVARQPERGRFRFGGWLLDRRSQRLVDPHGVPVALTKSEYALLLAFLDAPQRPLAREYLLEATGMNEDVFDRSIDVQVWRLRRKLEIDPSAPGIIQTERGVGYVFALAVEQLE